MFLLEFSGKVNYYLKFIVNPNASPRMNALKFFELLLNKEKNQFFFLMLMNILNSLKSLISNHTYLTLRKFTHFLPFSKKGHLSEFQLRSLIKRCLTETYMNTPYLSL